MKELGDEESVENYRLGKISQKLFKCLNVIVDILMKFFIIHIQFGFKYNKCLFFGFMELMKRMEMTIMDIFRKFEIGKS